MYYQKVYQNRRDLRISIYIEPQSSPPVRNATHLRTFCFLEVIFAFGEIFVNLRVLLQLDYIEDSPKLPRRMQRICGPFVLKTIIMNHFSFRETLCPVPLTH